MIQHTSIEIEIDQDQGTQQEVITQIQHIEINHQKDQEKVRPIKINFLIQEVTKEIRQIGIHLIEIEIVLVEDHQPDQGDRLHKIVNNLHIRITEKIEQRMD